MKPKKGRNSQIARIISLLDVFERATDGLTVAELHLRLSERGHEIGRRTIYRDIEALAKAGFPVFPEGEEGINQRFRLDRATRIPDYLAFTAKELFALFMARGALLPLKNTAFHADLASAFQKLEEHLGLKQVRHLDSLENELRFRESHEWGAAIHPEIVETLRAGCAERQVVECLYFSASSGSERVRRLGPHYLCYSKGGLYLVAEDLTDQKVKLFAVPPIKRAEMLPEAAPYVRERKWHGSQKLKALSGGKLRLKLEVSIDRELLHWILSFGPRARAIGPERLVVAVRNLIEETRQFYGP